MAAPIATTSSGLTPLWGSLPKSFLDYLLNLGHAGHAADQDDFVDFGGGQLGVGNGLLAWPDSALDEVIDELLELGAGERQIEMLGAVLVGGDETAG